MHRFRDRERIKAEIQLGEAAVKTGMAQCKTQLGKYGEQEMEQLQFRLESLQNISLSSKVNRHEIVGSTSPKLG